MGMEHWGSLGSTRSFLKGLKEIDQLHRVQAKR